MGCRKKKDNQVGYFTDDAWCLLGLMRFCGWFPVTRERNGLLRVRLFSCATVYGVSVLTLLGGRAVYLCHLGFQMLPLLDRRLHFISYLQLLLGMMVPQLFGLMAALQARNHAELCNQLTALQLDVARLRSSNERPRRLLSLGVKVPSRAALAGFVLIFLMSYLGPPIIFGGRLSVGYPLYLSISYAYLAILVVWMLVMARAVAQGAVTLLHAYQGLRCVHSAPTRRSHAALQSRHAWLRAAGLVHYMGQALALTQTSMLLVNGTGLLWGLNELLRPQMPGALVMQVTVVIMCASTLLLMCSAAHHAAAQIQRNVLSALKGTPALNLPSQSRRQMTQFFILLSRCPLSVNYGGYILVGRGLVGTLVSAVSANLVLLYQMKIEQKQLNFQDFFTFGDGKL